MSYLALARKWRPSKFEQVVGQDHVVTALENALKQNRLHHAYLFSGTRGVGKTSIGRLFAKGLNCETGITDKPCGQCDACIEIDQGRYVDLLEIDAASRTKVEDTRELLDNVQYKPARGRFKVYLIDEVHMLSRHSFNALLKTLEEPPEYVKFLLATTDPQKLPVTILSRCLQFHLKPITADQIHQQLDYILQQEAISSEARALGLISHAADGSMRDALSLSDQAIALGNGQIDSATVSNMLGTLDTEQAIALLEAVSSQQPQVAMDCLVNLAQNGVEWDGLYKELATQLHRIAMYQALPSSLNKDQPDAERIMLLSQKLAPQDVQLYYQMTLKGRQDLPLAPNEKMAAEMLLLRMLAFRPVAQVAANPITLASNSQVQTLPEIDAAPQARPQPVSAPRATMAANTNPSVANQAKVNPVPVQVNPASSQAAQPALRSEPQMVPTPSGQSQFAAVPTDNQAAPAQSQASPLTHLRHQLRSKRSSSEGNAGSNNVKKSNATNATEKPLSVLERIASQHTGHRAVVQTSPTLASANAQLDTTAADEPYQWKPSQVEVKDAEPTLTPTVLKRALEHEKTVEMAQKLLAESIEQDEWAAIIAQLDTAKLVEQLALNSTYHKQGEQIHLQLRAEQQHLNTDKAQQQLSEALANHFQQSCQLNVTIGIEGVTPLELRDQIYQAKLQQAFTSLENDPNVQFLHKRFAAQLDSDSVRPV